MFSISQEHYTYHERSKSCFSNLKTLFTLPAFCYNLFVVSSYIILLEYMFLIFSVGRAGHMQCVFLLATLKELISQTMVRWSQEDQIQDPELVRIMYSLLRRQYDSIGELLQALRKAYTISAASVKDTINLLAALGQIRSLLSVRMGKEEELLMINGLGYGVNGILFFSWFVILVNPVTFVPK